MSDQEKCSECKRVFKETDIFVYCTKKRCPMKSGESMIDTIIGKETGDKDE